MVMCQGPKKLKSAAYSVHVLAASGPSISAIAIILQDNSKSAIEGQGILKVWPHNLRPEEEWCVQLTSIKERQNDEYGQLHSSGLHSAGRIVLNLWRLLRSEIKLGIYTFESCVSALLQLRTPHLPTWFLSDCFNSGPSGTSYKLLPHCTLPRDHKAKVIGNAGHSSSSRSAPCSSAPSLSGHWHKAMSDSHEVLWSRIKKGTQNGHHHSLFSDLYSSESCVGVAFSFDHRNLLPSSLKPGSRATHSHITHHYLEQAMRCDLVCQNFGQVTQ